MKVLGKGAKERIVPLRLNCHRRLLARYFAMCPYDTNGSCFAISMGVRFPGMPFGVYL